METTTTKEVYVCVSLARLLMETLLHRGGMHVYKNTQELIHIYTNY